ncbi:uncharacterized protein LOC143294734 [Babylonia areolata]|uniref:uncharacterized protein LOC143294734 n=1 Tax=Babylonia areolata TaxID=304850 RepID=UPI003FCF2931
MGPQEDYIETVVTCEGNYDDPGLQDRLRIFTEKLENLLLKDEKKLFLKKIEPWNSVRVTFKIPKTAALRLKELAEQGNPTLRTIGVLGVQIQGDNLVSLTMATSNNQRAEVLINTEDAGQFGGSEPPASVAESSGAARPLSSSDDHGSPGTSMEASCKGIEEYLKQGISSILAPSSASGLSSAGTSLDTSRRTSVKENTCNSLNSKETPAALGLPGITAVSQFPQNLKGTMTSDCFPPTVSGSNQVQLVSGMSTVDCQTTHPLFARHPSELQSQSYNLQQHLQFTPQQQQQQQPPEQYLAHRFHPVHQQATFIQPALGRPMFSQHSFQRNPQQQPIRYPSPQLMKNLHSQQMMHMHQQPPSQTSALPQTAAIGDSMDSLRPPPPYPEKKGAVKANSSGRKGKKSGASPLLTNLLQTKPLHEVKGDEVADEKPKKKRARRRRIEKQTIVSSSPDLSMDNNQSQNHNSFQAQPVADRCAVINQHIPPGMTRNLNSQYEEIRDRMPSAASPASASQAQNHVEEGESLINPRTGIMEPRNLVSDLSPVREQHSSPVSSSAQIERAETFLSTPDTVVFTGHIGNGGYNNGVCLEADRNQAGVAVSRTFSEEQRRTAATLSLSQRSQSATMTTDGMVHHSPVMQFASRVNPITSHVPVCASAHMYASVNSSQLQSQTSVVRPQHTYHTVASNSVSVDGPVSLTALQSSPFVSSPSHHYSVNHQAQAVPSKAGPHHMPAGQDGRLGLRLGLNAVGFESVSQETNSNPAVTNRKLATKAPGLVANHVSGNHQTPITSSALQAGTDSLKMLNTASVPNVCAAPCTGDNGTNMATNSPSGSSRLLSDGDENSNHSPVSQTDGVTGPSSLLDANSKVDQHDSGIGSLSERSDDTTPSEVGDGDFQLSMAVSESSASLCGSEKKIATVCKETIKKEPCVVTVGCVQMTARSAHPYSKDVIRASTADATLSLSDKAVPADSVQYRHQHPETSTPPAHQMTHAAQELELSLPASSVMASNHQLTMKNSAAVNTSQQITGVQKNGPVTAVDGAHVLPSQMSGFPQTSASAGQPINGSGPDSKGSVRLHHLPSPAPGLPHAHPPAYHQKLGHASPSQGNMRGCSPNVNSSQHLQHPPTSVMDSQELRRHLSSGTESQQLQSPNNAAFTDKVLHRGTFVSESQRLTHLPRSMPMNQGSHQPFPGDSLRFPQLAAPASPGMQPRSLATSGQELRFRPSSVPNSQRLCHLPFPVSNAHVVHHPNASTAPGMPHPSSQGHADAGLQQMSNTTTPGLHSILSSTSGFPLPSVRNQIQARVSMHARNQRSLPFSSVNQEVQPPSAVMQQASHPPPPMNQMNVLPQLSMMNQTRFPPPSVLNQQRMQNSMSAVTQQGVQPSSMVSQGAQPTLVQKHQGMQPPSQHIVSSQQGTYPSLNVVKQEPVPCQLMAVQGMQQLSTVNKQQISSPTVNCQGLQQLSTAVSQNGNQQQNLGGVQQHLKQQGSESVCTMVNDHGRQQHAQNQMMPHSPSSPANRKGRSPRPRSVPNNYGITPAPSLPNRTGSPHLPSGHRQQSPGRLPVRASKLEQGGSPLGLSSGQSSPKASGGPMKGSPSIAAQLAVMNSEVNSLLTTVEETRRLKEEILSSGVSAGPCSASLSTPPSPCSVNTPVQLQRPQSSGSEMAQGQRPVSVPGQDMQLSGLSGFQTNFGPPASGLSFGPLSHSFPSLSSPSPASHVPPPNSLTPNMQAELEFSSSVLDDVEKLMKQEEAQASQQPRPLRSQSCESSIFSSQQSSSPNAAMTQFVPAPMHKESTLEDSAANHQAQQASTTSSSSQQPALASNQDADALPPEFFNPLARSPDDGTENFDNEERWALIMATELGKELKQESSNDCDSGVARAEPGGGSNITSMYAKRSSPVNVNMLNHVYAPGLPQPRRLTESVQRLVKPLHTPDNSLLPGQVVKSAGLVSHQHPAAAACAPPMAAGQGGPKPGHCVPMASWTRDALADIAYSSMVSAVPSGAAVRPTNLGDAGRAAQDKAGAVPNGVYHQVNRPVFPGSAAAPQVNLPSSSYAIGHNHVNSPGLRPMGSLGMPRAATPPSVVHPPQLSMVPGTYQSVPSPMPALPSTMDFSGSQGFKGPPGNAAPYLGAVDMAPSPAAVPSMLFQQAGGLGSVVGESAGTAGKPPPRRKRKNDGESKQGKRKKPKEK